jgi:predicted RNase H-like HicB family nuclease
MVYYVGILEGSGDSWGVRLFDFDGCVGAGETAEAAIAGATEALRDVVSYRLSGNHAVPRPTSIEAVLASGEVQAGESTVMIPLVVDAGRSVRANLTVDAGLLEAVDAAARRAGVTRSAFFASAAREKLLTT